MYLWLVWDALMAVIFFIIALLKQL